MKHGTSGRAVRLLFLQLAGTASLACHRPRQVCYRSGRPTCSVTDGFANGQVGGSDPPLGHVFVVHGDVTRLLADAVLIPTRNTFDSGWFPDGPPAGVLNPPANAFTSRRRVHRLDGLPAGSPQLYLGHVDGLRATNFVGKNPRTGRPGVDWFVQAAFQFLVQASADFAAGGGSPVAGRAKPLFALPVVGTGNGGARTSSGMVIARLLLLLEEFVLEHEVDVVLVVRSDPARESEIRQNQTQATRRSPVPSRCSGRCHVWVRGLTVN